MLNKVIGFLHIFFAFLGSVYFLWRSDFLDPLYVIYCILINIVWIFCNDECIVSYFVKLQTKEGYTMGESTNVEDIEMILGTKTDIFMEYIRCMDVFNTTLVLVVGNFDLPLKILLGFFTLSRFFYMHSFKQNNSTTLENKELIKHTHLGITLTTLVYLIYQYSQQTASNKLKLQEEDESQGGLSTK
jgi:glucose uptake protein GlcU